MNKEITIYELLGLIEDNKAPKKVKYNNDVWEFEYEFNDYLNCETYLLVGGFSSSEDTKEFLDTKVEILEEDKSVIGKISINGKDIHKLEELGIYDIVENIDCKLNEVIDCINQRKEK